MAYILEYRILGNSYPDAEQVGGDTDKMELEDSTPDGGIGITVGRAGSGRRRRTENAPSHVRWLSRRSLQDFEETRMTNVGARMRDLIEELEPGIHQFIPIDFVDRDGRFLEKRWFWQVCRRLDSVHRECTNWVLKRGVVWSNARVENPRLVFDKAAVGGSLFWRDKHLTIGIIVADRAQEEMVRANLTGLRYHHFEEA